MLTNLKKVSIAGAVIAAVLGINLSAMAEEITVTAASCFPIGSPPSRPFEAVVKAINEKGKGIIQIDLKGGAPAIGSNFTIVQKMSRGVYDMTGCPEGYFGNIVPEGAVLRLAEMPYSKLRENGGIKMVAELMEKKGIKYLGRHHDFGPFHLWLSKKIEKPDLTGLNLRVSSVYTPFFKSLGATVQTSNIAQVYTYMENGTVQGYGWPALGWVPAWAKVTKYRVEPGFYSATLHTLFNNNKWNNLSNEQKAVVTNVVMEFEVNSEANSEGFISRLKAQKDKTAKGGLEAITFEGADLEKWTTAAREAAWKEVIERSPENGAALKKLFVK